MGAMPIRSSSRTRVLAASFAFILLVSTAPIDAQRRATPSVTQQELARIWDAERVSPPLPPLLDHRELVRRLEQAVSAAPDLFTMETLGESVEGRSIHHIRAGTGSTPVLLWSQMHGDEPTATSAL